MRLTLELDARQAEALRLIARKEARPAVQYLRDAVFFLLRDRAGLDPEVRRILGEEPEAAEGKAP